MSRPALLVALLCCTSCRVFGVGLPCDDDAQCPEDQRCVDAVCAAGEGEGEGEGEPCLVTPPLCGGPGSFVFDFEGQDALDTDLWLVDLHGGPADGVSFAESTLALDGTFVEIIARPTVIVRDGDAIEAEIGEAQADDGSVQFGLRAFDAPDGAGGRAYFDKRGGSISGAYDLADGTTDRTPAVPYDSAAFTIWRITRAGDSLVFAGVSAAGAEIILGAVPMHASLQNAHVYFAVAGSPTPARVVVDGLNRDVAGEDECAVDALQDTLCDGDAAPLFVALASDACIVTELPQGGASFASDGTADDTTCMYASTTAWTTMDQTWLVPIDLTGALDDDGRLVGSVAVSLAAMDAMRDARYGVWIRDGDRLYCGEISSRFGEAEPGTDPAERQLDRLAEAALFELTVFADRLHCAVLDGAGEPIAELDSFPIDGIDPAPMLLFFGTFGYDAAGAPNTVVFGPLG